MSESESEKGAVRELYDGLFGSTWPVWAGGILLGALNICLFVVAKPWGGSGSYANWGQRLYSALGLFGIGVADSFVIYGLLGLLTLLGAFAGALLAREFSIRIPPAGEMVKGLLGGILMAIGATLAKGCSIGGFFSGWAALSGGAVILTLGLGIGTYIALRYLLWEMEKLPGLSSGRSMTLLAAKDASGWWQPVLGALVFFGSILAVVIIYGDKSITVNKAFMWFGIIGLLLGLVCQRSRFCIVRAFREPFMTGESAATLGVSAGLAVGIFGFAIIKYMGVRPAGMFVFPNFWLRGLVGGVIFGVGMTIAGGCAVGTLWRAGEGQVKLWLSAIGFLLMAPISGKFLVPAFVKALPDWAKKELFLPDTWLGYGGAIVLLLVMLLGWCVFAKWNERTGKFSAV